MKTVRRTGIGMSEMPDSLGHRVRGLIYRPLNAWQVLVWWAILLFSVFILPLEVISWFEGTSFIYEYFRAREDGLFDM